MLARGSKAPSEASLDSFLPPGKLLLVFFKVSCPTCQLMLPFLERLHRSGRLAVYGISQDDSAATGKFAKTYGLTFPILLDDARSHYPASNAYRIAIVPSLFLITPDRKIEWTLQGFSRQALEEIGTACESPVFQPGECVPEFKPG